MALPKNIPTPQQIIQELDKHIIGQNEAKKVLAIAMRNRSRRSYADMEKTEISPTNILMIGPTGIGKTELARRIAKTTKAPFVKAEATQFTEIGYVGKNVESIIHSLVDKAIVMVKQEKQEELEKELEETVNEIILDIVIPPIQEEHLDKDAQERAEKEYQNQETRKLFLKKITRGELDESLIELDVKESPSGFGLVSGGALDQNMLVSISEMMSKFMPSRTKKTKLKIKDAKELLKYNELDRRINPKALQQEAIQKTQEGIVFIDEIDKIVGSHMKSGNPDVSRGGVQQNLLNIVEGTTIATKIGSIKTDGILFIAAGAFHQNSPDDLMPELQGRFPIRVHLEPLEKEDYTQILLTPKNSLIKQNKALLAAEDIELEFTKSAMESMGEAAYTLNIEKENIGARRLRTVLSKVLDEIYLDIPENVSPNSTIKVDKKFVDTKLKNILGKDRTHDYIL